MQLSNEDIKILKYEKRIGFVLPGLIFCGLLFYDFFYITLSNEYLSTINLTIIINIIILSVCLLMNYLINRKVDADLNLNFKEIVIEILQKKEDGISYEAGSGMIKGQQMRPSEKYFFIIDYYRYEVEKTLYHSINEGDNIKMHITKNSKTLLKIEKY